MEEMKIQLSDADYMSRAGPVARLARFSVLEVTVILVLHEETSCLQRDWKQCACTCALCYPLSCCWFGSPG